MTKPYTVVAILEAKPGCEIELKNALIKVVQPSRDEDTCLDYRLHQGIENSAQFIFYENWESKAAHQLQFEKSYIKELSAQIGDLLAKPYQVIFAEEL